MSTKQTSREYFRSLVIIYYALIAGQLFFCLIAFFLHQTGNLDLGAKELTDIFIFIVPLFVIGGFFGSKIVFKNRLKAAKDQTNLFAKMTDYRGALVVRYALLEGPSFFAIIVYLLTGNLLFLGMSLLIIAYFFIIRPTSGDAITDLELSIIEEQLVNDPNSEIAELDN